MGNMLVIHIFFSHVFSALAIRWIVYLSASSSFFSLSHAPFHSIVLLFLILTQQSNPTFNSTSMDKNFHLV